MRMRILAFSATLAVLLACGDRRIAEQESAVHDLPLLNILCTSERAAFDVELEGALQRGDLELVLGVVQELRAFTTPCVSDSVVVECSECLETVPLVLVTVVNDRGTTWQAVLDAPSTGGRIDVAPDGGVTWPSPGRLAEGDEIALVVGLDYDPALVEMFPILRRVGETDDYEIQPVQSLLPGREAQTDCAGNDSTKLFSAYPTWSSLVLAADAQTDPQPSNQRLPSGVSCSLPDPSWQDEGCTEHYQCPTFPDAQCVDGGCVEL